MEIESGTTVETVGEHEIDFSIAQLMATSDSFRRWFVSQAEPAITLDEYIGGTVHASYAGEGESDLEFGCLTASSDRHLVLVENKINASKQPDQIERYYNRGQYRVERDDWDSFTVCLLAPERYVSGEDETGFDSIIHYEDVLQQIENLRHDGAKFLQGVFEAALVKSRTTATEDASDTLQAVRDQFLDETEIQHLESDPATANHNKRTTFRSTHPAHHDAIRYDVYVSETGPTGHTAIRLQIENADELPEEDREALRSGASQPTEKLPEYDWLLHRKKNLVTKRIGHEAATQEGSYSTYREAIVDELHALTSTFHPIFVADGG